MTGNWIDGGTVGNVLQDEATKIAARLGHRMTSWVSHPQKRATFVSRCTICNDAMSVAVRSLGTAPMGGPAVAFHCRASGPKTLK